MKYLRKLLFFLLLSGTIILITYCSNKSQENKQIKNVKKISSNGQIAFKVADGNDTIIVCNFSEVAKDVIDIKLSSLIDSCRIVRLETSENAFIMFENTIISENFIGVRNTRQLPFKLFDHSGKFIRGIGKVGRGPNEYTFIHSEIIDEEKNCIYLLPFHQNRILRYNLNGDPYEPINLKYDITKANLFIKGDTITILNLPFSSDMKIAYSQTFDGQEISQVPAKSRALEPDYGNEIITSKNNRYFDIYLFKFFEVLNDTLFHYENNRLKPVFTMFFGDKEIPIHKYFELPEYFVSQIMLTSIREIDKVAVKGFEIILVDKKTLEARRIRLVNDYLGNLEMDFVFKNGQFINNFYASTLKGKILNALKNDNLSVKNRDQLTSFNKSFNLDDNNIIFYGDLK